VPLPLSQIDAAIVFWSPGAWQPTSNGTPVTFSSINMSAYEQTIRNAINALYIGSPSFRTMLSDWVSNNGVINIGATSGSSRGFTYGDGYILINPSTISTKFYFNDHGVLVSDLLGSLLAHEMSHVYLSPVSLDAGPDRTDRTELNKTAQGTTLKGQQ
jgi:hypothetical protein